MATGLFWDSFRSSLDPSWPRPCSTPPSCGSPRTGSTRFRYARWPRTPKRRRARSTPSSAPSMPSWAPWACGPCSCWDGRFQHGAPPLIRSPTWWPQLWCSDGSPWSIRRCSRWRSTARRPLRGPCSAPPPPRCPAPSRSGSNRSRRRGCWWTGTAYQAAQQFNALCEGIAWMELRGNPLRPDPETFWRSAVTALVSGFSAPPAHGRPAPPSSARRRRHGIEGVDGNGSPQTHARHVQRRWRRPSSVFSLQQGQVLLGEIGGQYLVDRVEFLPPCARLAAFTAGEVGSWRKP